VGRHLPFEYGTTSVVDQYQRTKNHKITCAMIYKVLNYFFFFFHSSLILFNSFGWIFPRFRKWNLLTLLLTAFSWFVLGIWFGWGYCFCTDWHWMVRKHLGYHDTSNSYIHFLIQKLTGINFSEKLVNIRDYQRKQSG
jgi:hypothetical protein